MQVKVEFMTSLREAANIKEDLIDMPENCDINQLIKVIIQKYGKRLARRLIDPETSQLYSHIVILKNGLNIRWNEEGKKTPLHEGDVVQIIPPVCGG